MGDVIRLHAGGAQAPDNLLEMAVGNYKKVFVIGYDHDGLMDIRASTDMNHSDILWLLEVFKQRMLDGRYSGEAENG